MHASPLGVPRKVHMAGTVAVLAALLLSLLAVPAGAVGAPLSPTNLTAVTSPTTTDTTLSWNFSTGATGYQVRCQRQATTDIVRNLISNEQTVTVRLVADGYTLCGIKAQNLGQWSPEVYFPIVHVDPLPSVTGLVAEGYSGLMTVTWDRPAVVGLLDGWTVHVSPPVVDDQEVTVFGLPPDVAPSTVITGLAPGDYNITVTPFRSPDQNPRQIATFGSQFVDENLGPTPSAPIITDLTSGLTSGEGYIDISWDPPTSTAGSPISGYEVRIYNEWTGSEGTPFTATGDKRSLHITTAVAMDYWTVKVRAKNDNGYGAADTWHANPSSPWSDTVWTVEPPSPVGGLFVRVDNAADLWIDWTTPTYIPAYVTGSTYEVEILGATDTYDLVDTGTELDLTNHVFANGWYRARVRLVGSLNTAGLGYPTWSTRWFAVGTPCDHTFPDVTGAPFCTPIEWMSKSGITTGFNDGTFGPTLPVTRQAMAAFLYRAQGSPLGPDPTCTTKPFPDVEITNPFCGHIKWMVDEGITSGFSNGTFGPTLPVARQAMASFLYKASTVTPKTGGGASIAPPVCAAPNEFTDVSAANTFCGYIEWMKAAGITDGFSDGTFRPTESVTRQAMSSFLYRWHP